MSDTRKIELGFFLLLIVIAAGVSFFLLKPYLGALFVALVFAVVFRPSYDALYWKIRKPTLASLMTLLLLLLIILIPVGLFGFFVFDDAQKLYSAAAGSSVPMLERFDSAFTPIEAYVQKVIPEFEITFSTYAHAAVAFLVDNFGNVFSRVVSVVFQTVIMLLALFFLFRDGGKFRAYVVALSPLTNEYDERILKRLEAAIVSVVKGRLLIVLIQGILASIGFWLFGVPHAVLWGALTSLAALIPAFGVALIFIPVTLYVFLTGGLGVTIGMLVFAIGIGAIDNMLGPVLFERGLQMHPLLILLSVLGGLAFFGPVGFLAGPVVLSLLLALLDIYPLLFSEKG